MKLPIYQLDAFSGRVFAGNPAAVCPLKEWLSEAVMQAIAAENNLAETAFFVGGKGEYARCRRRRGGRMCHLEASKSRLIRRK